MIAVRATARRRRGYTHDVEVDGHSLVVAEDVAGGVASPPDGASVC